mgnify:CR=1 FL=1
MRRRSWLAIGAALAVVTLAGCGSDDKTSSDAGGWLGHRRHPGLAERHGHSAGGP